MAGQSDKFRVRLVDADTRFEPTHHRRRGIIGAKQQLAARHQRKLIIKRRPKFLRNWKLKIWRHDADDGRGFAINPNALTNDVGVGVEITPPDFVAQDRDFLCTGLVVLGRKIATNHRGTPMILKKSSVT